MKKIVSLVLILMFVLVPVANATAFFDVDDSYNWAIDAIMELTNKEIIKGYPDGSFKPQNNITNAETAKITVLSFGESDEAIYNDVNIASFLHIVDIFFYQNGTIFHKHLIKTKK